MKLVIFDIDGTLLYSNKIDSQCFADTYQNIYQRPFPSIDWTYFPHVSDTTIFNTVIEQHFCRKATAEEVNHFQDHFVAMIRQKRAENPHDFLEVPGARATVERLLDDEQFAIGIGTGGWRRPAEVKLAHVRIPMSELYMSCADGKLRREDILQGSIDLARARHPNIQRIIYVGDATWDVDTTRNMQIDFVGIRRNGDREKLLDRGAREVLADFSDYHAFLEALDRAVPPK